MSTEPKNLPANPFLAPPSTAVAAGANIPAQRQTPPPANIAELSADEQRRLTRLSEQANQAHELVKDAALRFCRHSIEAGIALLEARDLCPAKGWGAWLQDHFDGSPRTAQRYMKQAKGLILLGVKTTDVSVFHPEELSRLFGKAIRRIERRGAAAAKSGEADAALVVTVARGQPVEINDGASPPSSTDDPLVSVLALFNELLAALCDAIESGQQLGYGQFVLDELERIRGDVDACRLLLCDARGPAAIGA
ncbi:MAG TPA: hypothetical protein VF278_21845 [Pirellulales bacterium]